MTLVEPGVMRLDCTGSKQGGQGCMAFCKKDFPDNICVEFDFFMEKNDGLTITFIGMKGVRGEDALDGLPAKKGVFADYVQNKRLQSYHVSICRYNDVGRHTGVSNWRRNPGLNMMLSGKDLCKVPQKKYRVAIFKKGPQLQLQVDGKVASDFTDPRKLPGEIPTDGKIGFRLIGGEAVARFSNFKVTALDVMDSVALAQTPIDIGSRLELMVDDYLIDTLSGGAELRLHRPIAREVAIMHDKPWEGSTSGFHSVFRDGEIYRMYYRGAHRMGKMMSERGHPELVCYAQSTDGIHWTKPDLGIVSFRGSKKNNIIWDGRGAHAFSAFKDTNPDCKPQERYKAFAFSKRGPQGLLCLQVGRRHALVDDAG